MTKDQIAVGQDVKVMLQGKMGRPKVYQGVVVSMNKSIFTIDTKGKLESFHWSDMTTVGQGRITVELQPIGGDAMPRESVTKTPESVTGMAESVTKASEPVTKKPESLEGRVPATINPEFEKAVQKMADPDDEPIPYEVVKKPEPDECWQAAAEAGWKQTETETEEVYAPEGITEALADIIFKFNKEHQRGFDEGYEAGKAAAKVAMQNALEAC